jgi:hypothetical protein
VGATCSMLRRRTLARCGVVRASTYTSATACTAASTRPAAMPRATLELPNACEAELQRRLVASGAFGAQVRAPTTGGTTQAQDGSWSTLVRAPGRGPSGAHECQDSEDTSTTVTRTHTLCTCTVDVWAPLLLNPAIEDNKPTVLIRATAALGRCIRTYQTRGDFTASTSRSPWHR